MDPKEKTVSFRLIKITTEQFAVIENCYQKESAIKLETNLRFAVSTEARLIGVFAEVQFYCENKPFIIIEVGCHFEINEESWKNMILTKEVIVPKGIIQHLSALTVGSARGVLHAKTENTSFNQFILPTINISEIINRDVKFEIDSSGVQAL